MEEEKDGDPRATRAKTQLRVSGHMGPGRDSRSLSPSQQLVDSVRGEVTTLPFSAL